LVYSRIVAAIFAAPWRLVRLGMAGLKIVEPVFFFLGDLTGNLIMKHITG
jgi:hypothetical protein